MVQTLKSVLERYGIACEVKGEFPVGTRDRIAVTDLWVLDDARAEETRNILAQAGNDQASHPSWKCGKCGELLEGNLTSAGTVEVVGPMPIPNQREPLTSPSTTHP